MTIFNNTTKLSQNNLKKLEFGKTTTSVILTYGDEIIQVWLTGKKITGCSIEIPKQVFQNFNNTVNYLIWDFLNFSR